MVGGHQRYKILKARGDTEVVFFIVVLGPEQARLLSELQEARADVELTDFDQDEIMDLIAGLGASG